MKENVTNFTVEPVKEEYWEPILSPMKFYQWLTKKANKSTHCLWLSKQSAHFHIFEEILKNAGKTRSATEARAIAASIVQTAPHLRLIELAKLLERDISALVKAAQRIAGDVIHVPGFFRPCVARASNVHSKENAYQYGQN